MNRTIQRQDNSGRCVRLIDGKDLQFVRASVFGFSGVLNTFFKRMNA